MHCGIIYPLGIPLVFGRSLTVLRTTLTKLKPRQNGRHFPDDIFKWIFLNENKWISINVSLKFVQGGPINNIPTLVQVMAWRRPGDKPLSEPMMVRLPPHIWVTRPQWVNKLVLMALQCWYYLKHNPRWSKTGLAGCANSTSGSCRSYRWPCTQQW